MKTGMWWTIIVILLIVIGAMAWFLFSTQAPEGTVTGSTTGTVTGTATGSTPATSTQPLSAQVLVTSPARNAIVEKVFVISGTAPGPWYFEASFPIKVIDANGNVIANTHGQAQGDWMTTGLVTFTATASTTAAYSGPATVVLMRDNPSGLPENDDSVSVPVTIK
ncbi:Gmad2 immunoglobulin-like domain-containing protein [Candidatus Kaiserbacteria bacterium]|nr:Gmad2 immunoglobulin-like domain-containing protein [Candidatus Kaiserbacteria bacterium]